MERQRRRLPSLLTKRAFLTSLVSLGALVAAGFVWAVLCNPSLEGQKNGIRNKGMTPTSAPAKKRKKGKRSPQQKLKDLEIRGDQLLKQITEISDRRRCVIATAAARLWMLKVKQELATSESIVEKVVQCAKEAKKYVQEAGFLEHVAERIIWEIDEVLSHGNIEIRRNRKMLVLRTKSLMKHAARCTRPLKWVQKVDILTKKITKSTQILRSSNNINVMVLVELLRLILHDDDC